MSLARSLLRGAWSALRSAAWQPAAPAGSAAATAGLRGLSSSGGAGGSSAAAAACRLFSSSSASSMSSSSSNSTALLGAAGLRHLLRCCSGSIGGSLAAAGGGGGGSGAAWALQQARARTNSSHLVPKFKGGKIKPYSAYKSRFKVTGTGKVVYDRPGHVHKRFNKTKSQLFRLGRLRVMQKTYAKTVKKLGFKTRTLS